MSKHKKLGRLSFQSRVLDLGLPATKAMPKELIPIVNKPLIQYAAEEAIAAGIDTLIFVTGRNKRSIEDHFDANNELEAALRASGKEYQADMVRNILPGIECILSGNRSSLVWGMQFYAQKELWVKKHLRFC